MRKGQRADEITVSVSVDNKSYPSEVFQYLTHSLLSKMTEEEQVRWVIFVNCDIIEISKAARKIFLLPTM